MNHLKQDSYGNATQLTGMETQNDPPDLTPPCELNAVPWHDLTEKRQFLDGLDSMLMDSPPTDAT